MLNASSTNGLPVTSVYHAAFVCFRVTHVGYVVGWSLLFLLAGTVDFFESEGGHGSLALLLMASNTSLIFCWQILGCGGHFTASMLCEMRRAEWQGAWQHEA